MKRRVVTTVILIINMAIAKLQTTLPSHDARNIHIVGHVVVMLMIVLRVHQKNLAIKMTQFLKTNWEVQKVSMIDYLKQMMIMLLNNIE